MSGLPAGSIAPDHPAWRGYAKMSPEELGALLALVTDHERVRAILEIGALNGFSTVNMALALERAGRAGRITTIDIFQKDAERDDEAVFDENCGAFGLAGRIEKVRGYSADRQVLAALEGRQFDLVFHDAEHRYWPVLRDILNYERLVAPGGFFAFHDYVAEWSLREAVDEFFADNPAWRPAVRAGSLIAYEKRTATRRARWWRHRLGPKYLVRGVAFRSAVARAVLGLWGGRERWL